MADAPQFITISKLDAARRQLETAILLYFHEGDPVSIHTLACAAHEVIRDFNKATGGKRTMTEEIEDLIKPQMLREYRSTLKKAQNFFKHHRKGQERATVDLVPHYTQVIILDACYTYRRLTRERLAILATFEN